MKVATSRYFAKAAIEASGLTPVGFTRGWPKFGVSVDVVANLRAAGGGSVCVPPGGPGA